MGEDHRQRFLKPAADLRSARPVLRRLGTAARRAAEGKLVSTDQPHWDAKTFGDSCAGCHSTGVDSLQRTFSTRSLDCCVCHGEVPNDHTKNAALVHLSPRRKDPARVITSICAQCHVRTGTAKSTGRPYPNNFVAGDNLFRDFQVDLSDAAIARLDPADSPHPGQRPRRGLAGQGEGHLRVVPRRPQAVDQEASCAAPERELPDVPQRDRVEERPQALRRSTAGPAGTDRDHRVLP